ncbi:hypothetical protein EG327_004628 [Venturia inaequalis]|uniref:Zn(2)-C6 fungal-type domain-containing protein n=2 Tax=Venturia inaequalis TaxID=5025 RepID=A0A8H3Z521_VENIN|nr:hypothetical protein EG327_004628 [Venturia inaequalis]
MAGKRCAEAMEALQWFRKAWPASRTRLINFEGPIPDYVFSLLYDWHLLLVKQMDRLVHQPRKKKRASKPKVKTGCLTCKIRHVKCDETKPKCMRCTNTGRDCDGYTEPAPSKSKSNRGSRSPRSAASPSSPERQFPVFTGSVLEQRALEFFFYETAPQLSGFFTSRFWNGSVLQMSLSEPAIRYAMIAVSAMYEDENLYGKSPVARTESHAAFALEYYNKAISSLIRAAKANPDSIRVPVMAALIFICLEFLRGNVGIALTHIESGIQMLKDWRRKHCGGQSPFAHSSIDAEAAFIERELVPIFGCLNMLSSLFGRRSLAIYTNSLDAGESFESPPPATSIDMARVELTDLVNVIVRFIQSIGESKYKSDVSIDMIVEQIRLQDLFDKWRANYLQLVEKEKEAGTQTEHEKRGANLIQAISITLSLWLAASLSPNESTWDQYKDDYEEIVTLSQTLVPEVVDHSKHFSFEMGIIAPLHFVAWKCRWPHIRRKALALLKASPRRECLFESHDSCAVFTRVMLVEEEYLGLSPHEVPPEDELPPEHLRVHQVDIPPIPPTAQGNPINFLSKPHGISGAWHKRTDHVQLGNVDFEESPASPPSPTVEVEEKEDTTVIFAQHENHAHFDSYYTGLSVNHSETLISVGEFRPHEILEKNCDRRKIIFAAKQVHDLYDTYADFGYPAYMNTPRSQLAAGGLLRWHDAD